MEGAVTPACRSGHAKAAPAPGLAQSSMTAAVERGPPTHKQPSPHPKTAMTPARSLSDDLDQHPLPSLSIELTVENLLPRAKVELAAGYGHHHLPAHAAAAEFLLDPVIVQNHLFCFPISAESPCKRF